MVSVIFKFVLLFMKISKNYRRDLKLHRIYYHFQDDVQLFVFFFFEFMRTDMVQIYIKTRKKHKQF